MLGEAHHPVVILILHVELHTGELGIVELVHALVAEVFANFIHALEATYNQPLQIELGGDAHIHVNVEGIEMRDERACAGTTGNALQGGRLHLGVTMLVEEVAHGFEHGGTLQECVLHTLVDHQINVALTGAQLGIVEFIVGHTILIFHDGQRFEAFAQQGQLLGVHAHFACLRAEDKPFHAHEIANV